MNCADFGYFTIFFSNILLVPVAYYNTFTCYFHTTNQLQHFDQHKTTLDTFPGLRISQYSVAALAGKA